MTTPPRPAKLLWMQPSLPGMEPTSLDLVLRISMDGPTGHATINATVNATETGEWVAATVPVWRGDWSMAGEMLLVIDRLMEEVRLALPPF